MVPSHRNTWKASLEVGKYLGQSASYPGSVYQAASPASPASRPQGPAGQGRPVRQPGPLTPPATQPGQPAGQHQIFQHNWGASHYDRSSAVRRLAAAHWTTHQCPTTNRWPVIVQHKLPAEDRPLWPIRFDFRPKTDCRQKLPVKKNI